MEENKKILGNIVQIVEDNSKEVTNNSSEFVRLTPTGKISHAKTRVYTQRYRKEWEYMSDFKDWLTSVPYQATRAFCKFCQRNLHAHRLSLLKHMCTLKHQRAAVQYNKRQAAINEQSQEESNDITFINESIDTDNDEDNISYDDTNYIQEGEEISIGYQVKQEVVEEQNNDTLAQAIAHVQSDYLTENNEPIHLEMVVESDNDNDEDLNSYHFIKYENLSTAEHQYILQREELGKNYKHNLQDEETENNLDPNNENIKKVVSASESKNSTVSLDDVKKVYFFSSGDKSYTLLKSKLPHSLLNTINEKNLTIISKLISNDLKNNKDVKNNNIDAAGTSQDSIDKNSSIINSSSISTKSVSLKKPFVSTHVLEISKGIPVCGLQVSLYKLQDGRWIFIHESVTAANGDCNDFFNSKTNFSTGRYKFHYDTEKYYSLRKIMTIYPFIEIVFDIKDPNSTYYIPLLLSPFSYSTYKDSQR